MFKTKNQKDAKRITPLKKYWGKKLHTARISDNPMVLFVGFSLGVCFTLALWTISSF